MYALTRKSLMRHVVDQFALCPSPLAYVDFDAHGDLTQLPAGDVAGLHSFSLSTHQGYYEATWAVNVSTIDDENLFRLVETMDVFYDAFNPEGVIPLYDPVTAQKVGGLVIYYGTQAFPLERTHARAVLALTASGRLILDPAE
jgi:hypothetical protein